MNIGDKKAQQLVNCFKVGVSQEELMKSYGYDLDEINSGVILNDETIDGLIKGKLDTSHLVLKDVTVNGRVQKRWVNPNKNDSEHAQHGSEVSFSHRGESMKGKIGSVTKTGEYAIRGEDGKTYNKHAHQFDSPHEEQKAKDHASSTDTKKLQNFVSKDGTDPKLKKVAEEELKSRDDQNSDKKTNNKEVKEGSDKKIPESQVEKLDEEAEDDDNINAKFKTYEKFVRMTAKGMTKSTIVYGGGGVGKTYTAMKQLQNMKNPETGKPFVFFDEDKHQVGSDDYDVIKITGKATTAGLYKNLFQHNGKLVLFDDCDEVLKDDNSVNMFKGALDSTGDGTISNLSGRAIKGDDGNPIPQRYKFTGRAIFISNLSAKELPQPLKSRSLRVDLSMDADQTMERIKEIASHKESGKMTNIKLEDTNGKSVKYDHQDMVDAISFMDKHKNKMGDLNVRTLGSIVKLIHDSKEEGEDDDWQTSARHMVFSKGFFPSPNEISKAFNNIIQKR
jgi:hypothetical protein